MKIPKTIRIAGQTIQIMREDLSDENLFGYYSHDRKVIILSKELKEDKVHTTLRHELMEASLCISGVGFCETFEQEAVVRCMDEVFFPAYERLRKRLGMG
jgi:hypothetical protein|tara:strand:+ start:7080 stop:7379 length:300 start_codon:yes stop_codon:yes gene_type:complete